MLWTNLSDQIYLYHIELSRRPIHSLKKKNISKYGRVLSEQLLLGSYPQCFFLEKGKKRDYLVHHIHVLGNNKVIQYDKICYSELAKLLELLEGENEYAVPKLGELFLATEYQHEREAIIQALTSIHFQCVYQGGVEDTDALQNYLSQNEQLNLKDYWEFVTNGFISPDFLEKAKVITR